MGGSEGSSGGVAGVTLIAGAAAILDDETHEAAGTPRDGMPSSC